MIFSFKIGGPAGYGIKSLGEIFAKAFLQKGYYTFYYSEYPSLIRGGHNTVQVDVSSRKIQSVSAHIDLLVALDNLTLEMDTQYLRKGGFLIYEEQIGAAQLNFSKEHSFAVPFTKLAEQSGSLLTRNTVALGASLALLGETLDKAKSVICETFSDTAVQKENLAALTAGYDYFQEHFSQQKAYFSLKPALKDRSYRLITGNETIAMGALVGGCNFFCAYPMTPSTSIFHYLEAHQKKADIVAHQAEDEISVINTALGASFAGARVMVATSGGGFALMNEGLSLSGMAEIPLVIIEVMRPAPATGLPTWSEQGDLNFALGAGHGDFPKAILAPGDPEEAYQLIQHALNLAEKYQLPVIVLSDKFLGESKYPVSKDTLEKLNLPIERGKIAEEIKGDYKRYQDTPEGISLRALPGTKGGEHTANSDEHDEKGFSVEGYDTARVLQMEKRQRKMKLLSQEIPAPQVYGPEKADLTIVSWGANKGPILDALEEVKGDPKFKKEINYIHFNYIYPLPKKTLPLLKEARNFLLIENNQSAQFGKYLRQETGLLIKDKLLKYDGKPFSKEEILKKLYNFKS